MMKLIRCLFILLMFTSLQAQEYPSDCSDAYQICELGDFYFSNINGFGIQEDLNLENTEIRETNSIWLQFAAEETGSLEFVIVPENQGDDIDFVLFEGDGCSDLVPIRIMTSGEFIGAESSYDCLGQTGLRVSSNDVYESEGCFQFDDNFLKPVSLKEGKKYFLVINNFNSEKGFNILFSSEDNLKLVDKCRYNMSTTIDFEIFPNPALDEITLKSDTKIHNLVEVIMFDISGRIMKRKTFKSMTEESTLDVSNLPSGEYYLRIVSDEYTGLKSLIKI